jgi:hypothetical protein
MTTRNEKQELEDANGVDERIKLGGLESQYAWELFKSITPLKSQIEWKDNKDPSILEKRIYKACKGEVMNLKISKIIK